LQQSYDYFLIKTYSLSLPEEQFARSKREALTSVITLHTREFWVVSSIQLIQEFLLLLHPQFLTVLPFKRMHRSVTIRHRTFFELCQRRSSFLCLQKWFQVMQWYSIYF